MKVAMRISGGWPGVKEACGGELGALVRFGRQGQY